MPWLYDTKTGLVEHQNEAEYLLDQPGNLLGSGLVNLGIPDSDTSAQAMAAAQAYVKAHPGSAAPTTSTSTANQNADNYVASNIPGGSDVVAVTGFLGALSSANTWIRVAKVVVGGVLIMVGAAHLIGADKAVKEVARKVPVIP